MSQALNTEDTRKENDILKLRQQLASYACGEGWEERTKQSMVYMLDNEPLCFTRQSLGGHFTASGWIINPQGTKAVMMHHKKLDMWLQPGGHCDGDTNTLNVALTEIHEELGIPKTAVTLYNNAEDIFMVDMTIFPVGKDGPAHIHYDFTYLFELDETIELPGNPESHAIKWIGLQDITLENGFDPTTTKMAAKALKLKANS